MKQQGLVVWLATTGCSSCLQIAFHHARLVLKGNTLGQRTFSQGPCSFELKWPLPDIMAQQPQWCMHEERNQRHTVASLFKGNGKTCAEFGNLLTSGRLEAVSCQWGEPPPKRFTLGVHFVSVAALLNVQAELPQRECSVCLR